MTVLDIDPPRPTLRLVSSNGPTDHGDPRHRQSAVLYGDARRLYGRVLQFSLERQRPIDPDALRVVLATKQATTASSATTFTAAGLWQLLFVDVLSWCRTRSLDLPPGCATALVRTLEYLQETNGFAPSSDDAELLYDAIDECTGGWEFDQPEPSAPTPSRRSRSLRSNRGQKRT